MAQGHLDRLTSIDAGFLHMEEGGAHMHIGALGVFEGPAPSIEAFRAHIDARLPRLPRYRQRVQEMPLGTGRPLWVEDSTFRLEYHVRHTALPVPGSQRELLNLVDRVIGQRLDRSKPLWEMWLVEGLAAVDGESRWAIVAKTHHAMIDGVSGVDLMTVLFDLERDVVDPEPPPWTAESTPGSLDLLAAGAKGIVRNLVELGGRGLALATSPKEGLRSATDAVTAVVEAAKPLVDAAPKTLLNRKPGPHRLVAIVDTDLADYKRVKASSGGATVNDVVLTAVAGALGRFLAERGTDTDGLVLRACVPVSLRPEAKKGALGNEIAIMNAPLPVGTKDPVERLVQVRAGMEHLKSGKQAEGAKVLTSIENALPPAVLARASRLGFSSRLYNLLVTNVPGPQIPIYLLGRQLEELVPLAFLAPEHTLAIGIMSYHGRVTYGLVADADHVPDVDRLAHLLRESLAELVDTAS
ncbi:MAG: wax ester/triacylglycerol synthase family O-acyltransferase [Mycobacteriales bacterium]|nr:wax ester/triacylglycerol synthase family O-acyltransferase [Mycobacteriales bacterium]